MKLRISNREDLPRMIEVGKHGLIVQKDKKAGLLLPQVPVELGWNSYEFLNQTCIKAGLPAKSWLEQNTDMFTFTAEVFDEMSPGGKIVRKEF